VVVVALIVVLLVLLVGVGYLVVRRGASGEGANVDLAFDSEPTFDEEFREAAVAATPDEALHTSPEPEGAPPVPGAQWDEVAGRWIRWDPAAPGWIPVERG
jgi:hypothetical protein